MAVVIETTVGDITVDLYLDQRPVTCLNFLKLCKMKYYNYNLFHTIRSGFIAQTGDPSGEGSGGQSIFGLLEGPTKRFFSGEKMPKIRHTNAGLLSMVCTDDMMVGSQFFFTLAPDLDSLDGVHCVIGEVTEGHEALRKLNEVICDDKHRPYQDVRITHTVVLEDPFNDPAGFRAPSRSPSPSAERLKGGRIAPDEEVDETQGKSAAEIQEMIEEKEAKARATILEIVGDLPDADIAPPENVLFVCKLNPVTTDEDLEIIFSRFGKIVSCEVIRDKKTGDSLQYAFIEFSDKKSCEDAYFKMDNVLIDDRRIHVDFSQSVSKMRWLGKGRGVKYFNDDEDTKNSHNNFKTNRSHANDRERSGHNNHHNDKNNKNKKYDSKSYSFNDKEKRHLSDKNSRKYRKRSRSRSMPRASEDGRGDRNNSHSQNSRYTEKSSGEKSYNNRDHDTSCQKSKSKYTEDTNSHSSRSKLSPTKHKQGPLKSPLRSNKNYSRHRETDDREHKESDEKHKRREKHDQSNRGQHEESKSRLKRKQIDEQSESNLKRKKTKNDDQDVCEPRTPSPVTKENKRNTKNKKSEKRTRNTKKKRKPSTSSSDSDSSDSTSTSSDSSSSEDRRKKKKTKRRRRHSSSSSSTDSSPSSSSSSTSSDSSSGSSSSSSDSEPNKRKKSKKHSKSNTSKKSKKK